MADSRCARGPIRAQDPSKGTWNANARFKSTNLSRIICFRCRELLSACILLHRNTTVQLVDCEKEEEEEEEEEETVLKTFPTFESMSINNLNRNG